MQCDRCMAKGNQHFAVKTKRGILCKHCMVRVIAKMDAQIKRLSAQVCQLTAAHEAAKEVTR